MDVVRQYFTAFFILFFLLVSQFSVADTSASFDEKKLVIAKQIWEPVFSVTQNDSNLPVSKEQFLKANKHFYEAYAEFLDTEELILVKEMYNTSVGNKIAINIARSLFSIEPFALTYEDLSPEEKEGWEQFSRKNHNEIKLLDEKMKGFIPFLKSKFPKE